MTYATYTDAVQRMDAKVGEILAQLKADGLADDTIVVYCSDHGGVLPRSKRFLYSSGTHCPLIVRIPEKWKHWWPAEKPGMTVDRIVSFVDMPKTFLSLTGAVVPQSYQGRIFLGGDIEPAQNTTSAFGNELTSALTWFAVCETNSMLTLKTICLGPLTDKSSDTCGR